VSLCFAIRADFIGILSQISRSAVADYLCRLEKTGLSWRLSEDLSEAELEKKLFPAGAPAVRGVEGDLSQQTRCQALVI
jgi:hypothetical protein